MKEFYRKYLEPEYGEAAPECMIDEPQELDWEHPQEWRVRANFETIADLTALFKPCFCYPKLMTVRTENVQIHSKGHDIPVRIYLPEGNGPFPVMVFYHGGGWCMNNLDVYDYVPRYFAKYGKVLVITPEYRLAPEHPFPEGLEDAYDTLVWAAESAHGYGGDEGDISVCGDSAGGNFAAAVSLMARDRKGPDIKTQFLIYPATIFNLGYRPVSEQRYGNGDYFLAINSEQEDLNYYFKDRQDANSPYASPLRCEDLSKLPPACFISAECDPLLDQALMYAAKLEDFQVPVEYHLYKGMIHAFINRPYQKTFEAFDTIIETIYKRSGRERKKE